MIVNSDNLQEKFHPSIRNLEGKPDVKITNFNEDKALEILSEGKFCLVAREKFGRLSSQIIMASLYAGCVPIIIIDHLVLPFSEVLDWKRFSIRFYEHDQTLIYDHITSKVSC